MIKSLVEMSGIIEDCEVTLYVPSKYSDKDGSLNYDMLNVEGYYSFLNFIDGYKVKNVNIVIKPKGNIFVTKSKESVMLFRAYKKNSKIKPIVNCGYKIVRPSWWQTIKYMFSGDK